MSETGYRMTAIVPANWAAAGRALMRTEGQAQAPVVTESPVSQPVVRVLPAAVTNRPDALVSRLGDLAYPVQIMQAAALEGHLVIRKFNPATGASETVETVGSVDAAASLGNGGNGSNTEHGPAEEQPLSENGAETFDLAYDPSEQIVDQMIADLAREHRQIAGASLLTNRSHVDNATISAQNAAPVREPAKSWFKRFAR